DTLCCGFRYRQHSACVAVLGTCRLQVKRQRIVYAGGYPLLLQHLTEAIAFLHLYDIDIIDVCTRRVNDWQCFYHSLELPGVHVRMGSTSFVPAIEMSQFDTQYSSLHLIYTCIDA